MLSFLKNCSAKRVVNATAAGTSAVNSAAVDMHDADGVVFVATFGTLTSGAVTGIKAQQSDDDGGSDAYSDIEGSALAIPDTDSNKALALEIVRPGKRYVRCVVTRGTQNAVIDSVMAYKTHLRESPSTHDATVSGTKVLAGPKEGTA